MPYPRRGSSARNSRCSSAALRLPPASQASIRSRYGSARDGPVRPGRQSGHGVGAGGHAEFLGEAGTGLAAEGHADVAVGLVQPSGGLGVPGQQGGELLAEDAAGAARGAAEESTGGESEHRGPALNRQIVGGARVMAVDLARRLGTAGTGGGRRGGVQGEGNGVGSKLDTIKAEAGVGQWQRQQPGQPPGQWVE